MGSRSGGEPRNARIILDQYKSGNTASTCEAGALPLSSGHFEVLPSLLHQSPEEILKGLTRVDFPSSPLALRKSSLISYITLFCKPRMLIILSPPWFENEKLPFCPCSWKALSKQERDSFAPLLLFAVCPLQAWQPLRWGHPSCHLETWFIKK